jgi:hypothetical protein
MVDPRSEFRCQPPPKERLPPVSAAQEVDEAMKNPLVGDLEGAASHSVHTPSCGPAAGFHGGDNIH